MQFSHISGCPANDGEPDACFCDDDMLDQAREQAEDEMIAAASIPSPAQLLREAKERGWHQPLPAYGGEAGFPIAG